MSETRTITLKTIDRLFALGVDRNTLAAQYRTALMSSDSFEIRVEAKCSTGVIVLHASETDVTFDEDVRLAMVALFERNLKILDQQIEDETGYRITD